MFTFRFGLNDTADAFAQQADEAPDLIKSIVYPNA